MVRSTRWSAGLAVVVLVGAQPASADEEDYLDRTPENCITTFRIKNTDVIDERTIVFHMRGGDTYVNILDQACPRLEREKRFLQETRSGRLCDVDHIYVLEQFGGSLQRGATCQLGLFLPITAEEAADLERVGAGGIAESGGDVEIKEVELGPDGRPVGRSDRAAETGERAPDSAERSVETTESAADSARRAADAAEGAAEPAPDAAPD